MLNFAALLIAAETDIYAGGGKILNHSCCFSRNLSPINRFMKTTIIIPTYNWPKALELCLRSVFMQTVQPNEIIIADDGSTTETKDLIDKLRTETKIPIFHEWHEDKGFRKTIVLNRAIARASGDYILQVDGDTILNRHFISDHLELAEKNFFVCGSRVKLDKEVTEKIMQTMVFHIHWWNMSFGFFLNSMRSKFLRHFLALRYAKRINHLRGCNMAFWKEDLVKINGYNEDLTGWGHEDGELAFRLHFAGVGKKTLKMGGILYHLHHPQSSTANEGRHLTELQEVISSKSSWCDNGLNKYTNSPQE
jgi:glycosyltransferase involved in cell wall biosynthesis